MSISDLVRTVDELLGCSRKDKKLNLTKVCSILQDPKVHLALSCNSELHYLKDTARCFTWNTLLTRVLTVLMEEAHISIRSTKGEAKLNPDLPSYFKLLNIIAIHGCHGNTPVDLNEFIICFFDLIKDSSLSYIHAALVSCAQQIFRYACSYSLTLDSARWTNLVLWCCADLRHNCLHRSAYLLCLLLLRGVCSCVLPFQHVLSAAIDFLKNNFSSVSYPTKTTLINNLGWVTHMLRWLYTHVFVTFTDWHHAAAVLDPLVPNLLALLTEQRSVVSKLPSHLTTPSESTETGSVFNESTTYLSMLHKLCTNQTEWSDYSLAPLFDVTASRIPTIPCSSFPFSLSDEDAHKRLISSLAASHLSSDALRAESSFLIERLPMLCHIPSSGQPVMEAESIDVFDELFCLWRWALVFVHQHPQRYSLTSTQPPYPSRNCARALLQYLFQQWRSVVTRLVFQSEATCWKQIRSLRNYFGLFAALLLVIYDGSIPGGHEESEHLKCFIDELLADVSSQVKEVSCAKRQRLHNETLDTEKRTFNAATSSLWSLLCHLASVNEMGGCLWWLILDWSLRLKWQQCKATQCASPPPILSIVAEVFQLIPQSSKMVKTPVARECLLLILHTCLSIFQNELQQLPEETDQPLESILDAVEPCWATVLSIAELTSGLTASSRTGRLDASLCKPHTQMQDMLAHTVLSSFLTITALPSCRTAFTTCRHSLARQISLHFRKIDSKHPEFLTNLTPWRLSFMVTVGCMFPELEVAPISTVERPGISLFPNATLLFFIQQFSRAAHFCLDDTTPPDSNGSCWPSSGCLLSVYWMLLLNCLPSLRLCDKFHSLKWSLLVPVHMIDVPGWSQEQMVETIDHILSLFANRLSSSDSMERAHLQPDVLQARTLLFAIPMQLVHMRSHLSKGTSSQLTDLISPRALGVYIHELVKALTVCRSQGTSVMSRKHFGSTSDESSCSSSNRIERENLLASCLECIFHCLCPIPASDPYSSTLPVDQLVDYCLERPLPLPSDDVPQLDQSSSVTGDNEFSNLALTRRFQSANYLEHSSTLYPLQFPHQDPSSRFRILSSILSYALKAQSNVILQSIQNKLADLLSTPCVTTEAILWLCHLVSVVTEAINQVTKCELTSFATNSTFESMLIVVISCLVDGIREALKARLSLGNRFQCTTHLIQLVQSNCQLARCVVHIVRHWPQLTDLERWHTIGKHLDQLSRTVWSVGSKRTTRYLHGFSLVSTECVQAWFELHASGIVDSDVNSEYCLSVALRSPTPVLLFRFTDFLEHLTVASHDRTWAIWHNNSLLSLIRSTLNLLDNNQFEFQSVNLTGCPPESSPHFDMAVHLHRVIQSLLIRLSSVEPLCPDDATPHDHAFTLRPEVECFVQSCDQLHRLCLTACVSKCSDVHKLLLQTIANSDLQHFEVCVRSFLLPLMLAKWIRSTVSTEANASPRSLEQFPWRCWALDDFVAASKSMQSELLAVITSTMRNRCDPIILQTLQNPATLNIGDTIAALWFDDCHTNGSTLSTSDANRSVIVNLLNTSQHTVNATSRFLTSAVERFLRLLSLTSLRNIAEESDDRSRHLITTWDRELLRFLAFIAARLRDVAIPPAKTDTFEDAVQTVCHLFGSNYELVSKVDALLELSARLSPKQHGFLKDDIVFPHHRSISSCTTVTSLIIFSLFFPSSPHSIFDYLVELKNFAFWRMASFYLEWISMELQRPQLSYLSMSQVLSSLEKLFFYSRTHTHPDRDIQMESALHHATVTHLTAVGIRLLLKSDASFTRDLRECDRQSLLDKVSFVLSLLVSSDSAARFQSAICQLPDFPHFPTHSEANIFFHKHQQALLRLCSCNRSHTLHMVKLYFSHLDKSHCLRCPQVLRYQSYHLERITNSLRELFAAEQASLSSATIDQLELMVASESFIHHTISAVCQDIGCDAYGILLNLSSAASTLTRLLSAAEANSPQLGPQLLCVIDRETIQCGLECLSTVTHLITVLQRYLRDLIDLPDHFSAPDDGKTEDPYICGIKDCILDVAQSTSFVGAPYSFVACQVLRGLFEHNSSSVVSLLPSRNNDYSVSLSTKLFPYLEALKLKRDHPYASEGDQDLLQKLSNMSNTEIKQYATDRLNHFITTSPHSSDRNKILPWLSDFIFWLLDLPVLLQKEVYTGLRPLLPLSIGLCQHLFPWVIADFLTTSTTMDTCHSLVEQLQCALAECITNCLTQDMTPEPLQHLWIDSMVCLNSREQWRHVHTPKAVRPLTSLPDWLSTADRAVKIGRPYDGRMFLELAWLSDDCPDNWLTTRHPTRRIWLSLCRLLDDLPGLHAAQTMFLPPCSTSSDLRYHMVPLQDADPYHGLYESRESTIESFRCWSDSAAWHDVSPGISDVVSCLRRLGAHNLFHWLCRGDQFNPMQPILPSSSGPTTSDFSQWRSAELQELRCAAAWRLTHWDSTVLQPPDSPAGRSVIPLGPPPNDWSSCGLETVLYWILHSAQRRYWTQVSAIASQKCHHLLRTFCLNSLGGRCSNTLLSICGHQLNFFHRIQKIVEPLTSMVETSIQPVTTLEMFSTSFLALLNTTVDHLHFIESRASSLLSTFSDLNARSSVIKITEPFVTSSIRLAMSLAAQFPATEPNAVLLARSYDLLTHVCLHAAESAVDSGLSQLTDDWLLDARVCESLTVHHTVPECTSTIHAAAVFEVRNRLRSVQLQSRLEHLRGKQRLAISRLQAGVATATAAMNRLDEGCPPILRQELMKCLVQSVTHLSSWLFESRTKSGTDLLATYLEPTLQLATQLNVEVDSDAFACVARFADAQFTTLDSYMSSSEYSDRRQLLSDAQRDVAVLTDLGEKSRLLRILQRQSAIELEEMEILTSDADRLLETALNAYAQCLTASDSHDLKIYRFISLWLSTAADAPSKTESGLIRAENVNKLMATCLPAVRADKFLPLMPQLAVRLSSNTPTCGSSSVVNFQTILSDLVERVTEWHPHHSAFILLFLVNADLDELYVTPKNDKSARNFAAPQRSRATRMTNESNSALPRPVSEHHGRANAARRVLNRLYDGRRGPLLRQMQSLAEAYVEWANADVDAHKGNTDAVALPSNCKLQRFVVSTRYGASASNESLDLVAVPTATLRIDRSGEYPPSSFVRIAGFAPKFRLAGGINLPKIVTCLGTDGRERRQLVKGKDDPRQDAVMQQVFAAANRLLSKRGSHQIPGARTSYSPNSDSSQNCSWMDIDGGLRIHTYKVIPMAQRTGVIEWCENTVPLGEWLAADRSGAHQRYRPRDMPPGQARQKLAAVRDRPPERRRVVFDEICEKLSPVLAYFYLENFRDPQSWCRARYAYTRSLAASSLVGYLVGLGDRHPQNLLLHRTSGELIHIDLGVAFDQGRLLPTPEAVPFRLTRDLVHALGPLGLESAFIPAAEIVLTELRNASDVILTLLQVLLHDPLYSWSMTPTQLCALEARRAEFASRPMQSNAAANRSVLTDQTNLPGDLGRQTLSLVVSVADPSGRSVMDTTTENAVARVPFATAGGREPLNQLAERVLLNVRGKLEGRVTGNLAASSSEHRKCGGLDQLDVSGHVSLLVRSATDRSNLSRMYFGWQAYL